jgi:hypothetical protein
VDLSPASTSEEAAREAMLAAIVQMVDKWGPKAVFGGQFVGGKIMVKVRTTGGGVPPESGEGVHFFIVMNLFRDFS